MFTAWALLVRSVEIICCIILAGSGGRRGSNIEKSRTLAKELRFLYLHLTHVLIQSSWILIQVLGRISCSVNIWGAVHGSVAKIGPSHDREQSPLWYAPPRRFRWILRLHGEYSNTTSPTAAPLRSSFLELYSFEFCSLEMTAGIWDGDFAGLLCSHLLTLCCR